MVSESPASPLLSVVRPGARPEERSEVDNSNISNINRKSIKDMIDSIQETDEDVPHETDEDVPHETASKITGYR